MNWIYISPHLDDIALSLGGLLWDQSQAGERVSVWTLCSGDPPPGPFSDFAGSLHARWGVGRDATAHRRREDALSCSILGATHRHLEVPDCIYRRSPVTGNHLYASEEAIRSPLHPDETPLVRQLQVLLAAKLPPEVNLVCPLALGRHVDHRLARTVLEGLDRPLRYYADYPYVLEVQAAIEDAIADANEVKFAPSGWGATTYPVTPEGAAAWEEAIAAHASQISTFWPDLPAMRQAIREYHQKTGGVTLWQLGD
jgi:LmbE family N-acetylglucosaminyl deacetylase